MNHTCLCSDRENRCFPSKPSTDNELSLLSNYYVLVFIAHWICIEQKFLDEWRMIPQGWSFPYHKFSGLSSSLVIILSNNFVFFEWVFIKMYKTLTVAYRSEKLLSWLNCRQTTYFEQLLFCHNFRLPFKSIYICTRETWIYTINKCVPELIILHLSVALSLSFVACVCWFASNHNNKKSS